MIWDSPLHVCSSVMTSPDEHFGNDTAGLLALRPDIPERGAGLVDLRKTSRHLRYLGLKIHRPLVKTSHPIKGEV